MDSARTVGIGEAMRLTGLSRRALEGRVERGTLAVERESGRLRFSLEELYERGLIPLSAGGTVAELLDRIEALARRVGELEAELRQARGDRD